MSKTWNTDLRDETDRVTRLWNKMAPKYDREVRFVERLLFAGGREWVCSQAWGEVLEIAVGTGRNVPYYPGNVRITGVDVSPAMLEIARARARDLGREVELRVGDVQRLEFPDASFDTAVSTLALCSIPDDARAVAEVRRVLRPAGSFLLMEHVASPYPLVRAGQGVLDWFTVRFQGDHQLRRPLERLKDAGFEIVRVRGLKWGIVQRIAARKPAQ